MDGAEREQPAARPEERQTTLSEKEIRWIRVAILVAPFVLWWVVRNRPPWGDEEHFLHTVRLFGAGISLDLLRSYPELSAPLTYILYSAWGHVIGFATPELRLLSPVLASLTALTWFAVLTREVRSRQGVWLALATTTLNPYFIGLSVFVFTDMLALLGLAMVALGVSRRKAWLSGSGLAVAVGARQYLAFLAVAMVLTALLSRDDRRRFRNLIMPAVIGITPLALLILLWGGHLAPASDVRDTYLSEGVRFDPHALSLYLSSLSIYAFPLVLVVALRSSREVFVAATAVMAFVLAFPVQPSIAQTRDGLHTVGFIHRAIDAVANDRMEQVVFAMLAFVNGAAILSVLSAFRADWRARRIAPTALFMLLGVVAFLLVMPFSFMPWEKYALPLCMMQGATLAMVLADNPKRHRSRHTATFSARPINRKRDGSNR